MKRIIEEAITRAGLWPLWEARADGDMETVRTLFVSLGELDILVLGALADAIRVRECGDVVRVHWIASREVTWVSPPLASPPLDLLRAAAIARILGPIASRVGVDWGRYGLEIAQVALGFGVTDLTGPVAKKSGALIHEDELRKVKGKGTVAHASLKRQEIAALVAHAGRSFEEDHA